MKRRKALSTTAIILGGTIVGADAFLSGCKPKVLKTRLFGENDILLLDEVGETILPATDSSPGAKEARIGEFMKTIVLDCYEDEDQKIFVKGIEKLETLSKTRYNLGFMDLSIAKRHDLLVELDKEVIEYKKNRSDNEPTHYFEMMKQLTIWGYFTSEVGSTKSLRHVAVPGRFEGCIPYQQGEGAWAI